MAVQKGDVVWIPVVVVDSHDVGNIVCEDTEGRRFQLNTALAASVSANVGHFASAKPPTIAQAMMDAAAKGWMGRNTMGMR